MNALSRNLVLRKWRIRPTFFQIVIGIQELEWDKTDFQASRCFFRVYSCGGIRGLEVLFFLRPVNRFLQAERALCSQKFVRPAGGAGVNFFGAIRAVFSRRERERSFPSPPRSPEFTGLKGEEGEKTKVRRNMRPIPNAKIMR